MQANHANFHAIFFDNGIGLIPERFIAVLIKNIALNNRECRLAKLKQRIIPAVIELMITDSHRIVGHRIHNIDYRFALRQATDVRPGKIIPGIKKPGRVIFRFFLFHHRRDIRPTANISFTIRYPWHFIRFDMGMKIVGINDGDIFGAGPERQS